MTTSFASASRESSQSSAEPPPNTGDGDGDGERLSNPQMTSSLKGTGINTPDLNDNDDTIPFAKHTGSDSREASTGSKPTEGDSTPDEIGSTATSAQRSNGETVSSKSNSQAPAPTGTDRQHNENPISSFDSLDQVLSADSVNPGHSNQDNDVVGQPTSTDQNISSGVFQSMHESPFKGLGTSYTAMSHATYTSVRITQVTTIHDPLRVSSIPIDGEASSQDPFIAVCGTSLSGAPSVINEQTSSATAATLLTSDHDFHAGDISLVDSKTTTVESASSRTATSKFPIQTDAIAKLIMYGIGASTTTCSFTSTQMFSSTSATNDSSKAEGEVEVSKGDAARMLTGSAHGLIGLLAIVAWL